MKVIEKLVKDGPRRVHMNLRGCGSIGEHGFEKDPKYHVKL